MTRLHAVMATGTVWAGLALPLCIVGPPRQRASRGLERSRALTNDEAYQRVGAGRPEQRP